MTKCNQSTCQPLSPACKSLSVPASGRDRVTPAVLRELLRYEPDTGRLFWKERDPKWFRSTAKRTAEHACNAWNAKFAGKEALTAVNGDGYRHGLIFDKPYKAHRVAFAIHHGAWPKEQIDHIDHDRSNNRISNLRDVPQSENQRNTKLPCTNTSGVMGVSWDKSASKWAASISINGNRKRLGFYQSLEMAAAAYRYAARRAGCTERHGEGATIHGDTGLLRVCPEILDRISEKVSAA